LPFDPDILSHCSTERPHAPPPVVLLFTSLVETGFLQSSTNKYGLPAFVLLPNFPQLLIFLYHVVSLARIPLKHPPTPLRFLLVLWHPLSSLENLLFSFNVPESQASPSLFVCIPFAAQLLFGSRIFKTLGEAPAFRVLILCCRGFLQFCFVSPMGIIPGSVFFLAILRPFLTEMGNFFFLRDAIQNRLVTCLPPFLGASLSPSNVTHL